LFRYLWKIKRAEYLLSKIWHLHTKQNHAIKPVYEVQPYIHRCHLLRNEMAHFIQNLRHYLTFNVLELSWNKFQETINSSKSLDSLIEAHKIYLLTVKEKALLTEDSLQKKEEIITT